MFDFAVTLSDFEQATLEQLVSFKAAKECDIARLMNSESLQQEAIKKVALWDQERIRKGLKPWNKEVA